MAGKRLRRRHRNATRMNVSVVCVCVMKWNEELVETKEIAGAKLARIAKLRYVQGKGFSDVVSTAPC